MKPQLTELHPLVQDYLHELHVLRQLSPHTLKAYRMDLAELQNFATDDAVELLKVSNAHVRRWAGRWHAKGKSPRTIARGLSAWRGWYDWLTEKDARRDGQAGRAQIKFVQPLRQERVAIQQSLDSHGLRGKHLQRLFHLR